MVTTDSPPPEARVGGFVPPVYPFDKLAPLLSTIGFSAKPGEVAKVPTGGTIKSPLLILVGLGDASAVDAAAVRRAAGVAARAVSNAASVAIALPALDDHQVRAVVEGTMLGGYAFSAYRTGAAPAPRAPRKPSRPPGSSRRRPRWPATG